MTQDILAKMDRELRAALNASCALCDGTGTIRRPSLLRAGKTIKESCDECYSCGLWRDTELAQLIEWLVARDLVVIVSKVGATIGDKERETLAPSVFEAAHMLLCGEKSE